jgi:hypothetical protein
MCCLLAGLLRRGYLLLMELRDGGPELVLAGRLLGALVGGHRLLARCREGSRAL